MVSYPDGYTSGVIGEHVLRIIMIVSPTQSVLTAIVFETNQRVRAFDGMSDTGRFKPLKLERIQGSIRKMYGISLQ
jgi:hypothetical protein